ncbi:hypothetical protein OH764_34720 (plasmid) [Burkholderia sp. M6-3]
MTRNLALKAAAFALPLFLTACGGGSSGASLPSNGNGAPSSASGTAAPQNNAASVEGIDSAGRGYRDDVAQLIADKYSAALPAIRAGAEVAARVYQRSITASTLALSDTSPVLLQGAQEVRCAAEATPLDDLPALQDALHVVYARTFNTDARMAARQSYNAKVLSVGAIPFDPTKCVK